MARLFLLLIVFTLNINLSFAQENLLMEWFESLEKNFEYLVSSEKKKQIGRNMKYLAGDLDEILTMKQSLNQLIFAHCEGNQGHMNKISTQARELGSVISMTQNRLEQIRKQLIFTDGANIKIGEEKFYHENHPDNPINSYGEAKLSEVVITGHIPKKKLRQIERERKKYDKYTEIFPITLIGYEVEEVMDEFAFSLSIKGGNLEALISLAEDCELDLIEHEFVTAQENLTNIRDISFELGRGY